MTVAALYDIHGNLPALEAVLREVREAGAERILVGGDVVPGPMPRECFETLLALDVPVTFIRGNGERETLSVLQGEVPVTVPERFRKLITWSAAQLGGDYEQMLASLPAATGMTIDGIGHVYFCHATPRNDVDIFTRRTDERRLLGLFEPVNAAVAVCGHTHMQFDRNVGPHRVVNAGSVGMPFGEPGAYWLLLGHGDVGFERTSYDLAAAAARIRATAYPSADEFATRNVLSAPSEADMLDAFSRAEVSERDA